LDSAEKAIVKEVDILIKSFTEKSDEIAKLTQKYFITRVISNIISKGGKILFGTVLLISKMAWAIGRPLLQLAGIYYTFDEVYLALYGTDEQKMKLRNDSSFQKLLQLLKDPENQKSAEEQAKDYLNKNSEIFKKNPELIATVDATKSAEVDKSLEDYYLTLKGQNKSESKIQSPSLENVISKKIDPSTKKPYTIKEGQKGESVGKIQEMLGILGFDVVLKGYNETKKGVDNDFGPNTYDAVVLFQEMNGLKETGEIDSDTLTQLKIKVEEKINEK
jgi:murein L,D-transpeptidase YcbB/YkuD